MFFVFSLQFLYNFYLFQNNLLDWSDENCVKIIQHCKQAIPSRTAGGKVIIIEMVRGSSQGDNKNQRDGSCKSPAGEGAVDCVIPIYLISTDPIPILFSLLEILPIWIVEQRETTLARRASPLRHACPSPQVARLAWDPLGPSIQRVTEVIRNMFILSINGVERDINEWKKILSDAGFTDDCKIMPVLGPFSVIEIYPS